MCQLADAKLELSALKKFGILSGQQCNQAAKLLSSPGYSQLIDSPLIQMESWQNAPYLKNTGHPENLIHKTLSGILVRSKSEVIIANHLLMNHIPFRYEEMLENGGGIRYPDFKTLHPKSGKIIYWEHFGMIDRSAYLNSTIQKLQFYSAAHIYPMINMITTFETEKSPLDSSLVEALIQQFFF